jgi:HSP20 family protein
LTVLAEWSPAIEISENDKEYLIRARFPELKNEDVKVTAEKGTLTMVAHRKFEPEEKDKKQQRIELTCGSFGRTFSLPDDVCPANISAEFKDGVLVVHLVKGQTAGPPQVEVMVS